MLIQLLQREQQVEEAPHREDGESALEKNTASDGQSEKSGASARDGGRHLRLDARQLGDPGRRPRAGKVGHHRIADELVGTGLWMGRSVTLSPAADDGHHYRNRAGSPLDAAGFQSRRWWPAPCDIGPHEDQKPVPRQQRVTRAARADQTVLVIGGSSGMNRTATATSSRKSSFALRHYENKVRQTRKATGRSSH
jgi:hypothetical protein